MATVSDITNTVTSGLNHIDALLDTGPDWNYLTPAGNTILYTFSIATGNEAQQTGQQVFSAGQQSYTSKAIADLTKITGINFVFTADGGAAQIHFCNVDIADPGTTGLCSWRQSYSYTTNNDLVSYDADAYVYLDNREYASQNTNLAPGGTGYETLLHELGHAMGLKHPFDDSIHLPAAQDSTANTLMSYNHSGGPYASFRPYDIAALNWIYGGDGLRGALGIGSVTGARYFTGTSGADTLTGTQLNDTLQGDKGNDMINGGDGIDTAIFNGTQASYKFSDLNGNLLVTGADGSDILSSVEILQFSDSSVQRADIDTTPPPAPTVSVSKNAAGYVLGDLPYFSGLAEANSTVHVYNGATDLGSTKADANGFYTFNSAVALADGLNYVVYAKATDAAGNVSQQSATIAFNVDAHAPAPPSGSVAADGSGLISGNQAVFSGTADAGTTLDLVNTGNVVLGHVLVGANGNWSITTDPLADGSYSVVTEATDQADNTTQAAATLQFNVLSSLNRNGGVGNDSLTGSVGNNAIDGKAGIDTANYTGLHSDYTIAKSATGFTVTANGSGADGRDSLINVERIQFGDTAVAIDLNGNGGEAYRVYQAAFNRTPDKAGVGFWIAKMDQGVSLHDVANGFLSSNEFTAQYGANSSLSTTQFVTELYSNVLHRPLDQAGADFWVTAIDQRGAQRADVLAQFSESAENQAQVIGSIQAGFEYTPYHG